MQTTLDIDDDLIGPARALAARRIDRRSGLGPDARRHRRLAGHANVTDTYLLALAVAHGGALATFDRRLGTDAVPGGAQALHLIATP